MSSEPIRVLRIMARPNVGGPALQLSALARGLDPERFDQRILVGYVADDEEDYLRLRASDVDRDVERVPGLGRAVRPSDDARALATIVQICRSFRPHIVHTHTAKAGALGRTAAALTRIPHRVHTFHGHLLHGYFSPRVTRAVIATERALAYRTDVLVAVGSRVRDELLAAGIGRTPQYRIVPPGVLDLPRPDTAAARRVLGVPVDAPVVAFVARLTAVKRPDRFADAMIRVQQAHPGVHVVVAGDGPLLAELRAALAPLGSRGTFLGFRDDVETVYAAADLAVLSSDNEGMPVSLIEAAMAGRAAVTTDVGSAREVVLDGETGTVVAATADAIASAVTDLIASPDLRRQYGVAARAHAQREFSAARLVTDTDGIYTRLVGNRLTG